MNVVEVKSLAGLQAEWNALTERSASGFITLTWEWVETWWEVFGDAGRQLCVLVARDGDRLVGIAPLQRRTVRQHGLPFQRIEFLCSGEDESDEICSDYLDFLCEPGREAEVTGAFVRHLAGLEWDEIVLAGIRGNSPNLPALRQMPRYGESPRKESVVVPLAADWETFLMTLSKKMRFRVRRHRRLIADKGPVAFRRVQTEAELVAEFPRFVDLHQRWWTSRGKPGCFASAKFSRFHELVARRLFARGLVDLYFLSVAGQDVATRYAFHFRGTMFDYQTGVDPEFDPRIGVGVECTGYCMEDAIQRGLTAYDFGEGAQPYKLRWTDQLIPTLNVRIARGSLKESARSGAATVIGRLRAWKHRSAAAPATAEGED